MLLVELTVMWSFPGRRGQEIARYTRLALDIQENRWTVTNIPLEIGARGMINIGNNLNLKTISNLCGMKALKRLIMHYLDYLDLIEFSEQGGH